MLMIIHEAKLL